MSRAPDFITQVNVSAPQASGSAGLELRFRRRELRRRGCSRRSTDDRVFHNRLDPDQPRNFSEGVVVSSVKRRLK